jgi:hypothetical protein
VNYLVAAIVFVERAFVSFFTTDSLSGVSYYEVGVVNADESTTVSPLFIQTESPFQVPLHKDETARVIVRAVDGAGNTREAFIEVRRPLLIEHFIKENLIYILLAIIFVGFVILVMHYLFGHHIISSIKETRELFKKIQSSDRPSDEDKPAL